MGRAYDAIVIGLGAAGSATLDALAARGRRVLGLDRFTPPHDHGSSHGRTRVIRQAYFEHPLYVPLVRRAYELWAELEREAGHTLLQPTGVLSIGPPEGSVLQGTRRSVREHGLPHEELAADEVRARWPAIDPPPGSAALFEARGGLLFPEACIEALLGRAAGNGAEVRTGEAVAEWRTDGGGVAVATGAATYSAGAIVVSAGPWAASLLPGLALPLSVERQVMHWFAAAGRPQDVRAGRCPVVLWEHAPGRLFYTTPDTGDGVKAALHHQGEAAAPDAVRSPGADDAAAVRALLQRIQPGAAGTLLEARTCLYTNTPDGHFVVDRHPQAPQAVVLSPCSGHGFKFAPAIGEVAASLLAGDSRVDLAPFSLRRFA